MENQRNHQNENLDDIFATLSNCNVFYVIDLTGAFKQLSVSEKSQEYLTVNTQKVDGWCLIRSSNFSISYG